MSGCVCGKCADVAAQVVALELAAAEARSAAMKTTAEWGGFNSAHEAFAVLAEELDELKAHVWTKQRNRDLAAMRAEALDVAAVAIRFAALACDETTGRR